MPLTTAACSLCRIEGSNYANRRHTSTALTSWRREQYDSGNVILMHIAEQCQVSDCNLLHHLG